MPKVNHFDIPANNPEKAMEFYKKVFGWRFQKWEGPIDYWFSDSGNPNEEGINGAIGKKNDPNEGIVNTIGVDNLDKFIQKIIDSGGKITNPKHAIQGVGWLAYFEDLDGNTFGLMQDDPNAK